MTISMSIAMATFNGARFLHEQLESIAAQTYSPLELVVGDDGSSDETMTILHDFALRADFQVRVQRNRTNLGFADNFLTIASRCSGDWIAFCDQDDRWYPDKLAAIAARAQRGDACLVVHPLDRAEAAGNPTGERVPPRLPRDGSAALAMPAGWHHGGCGMAFDAALLREIDWRARPRDAYHWSAAGAPPDTPMPHDFWISLLGNLVGGIGVVDRPLGIFRRHDATVTGPHRASLRRDLAVASGSAAYAAGQRAASDAASRLDVLAQGGGRFAAALAAGAAGWRRRAEVEAARAALYRDKRTSSRLARWTRMAAEGAYIGDSFASAGARAMAKDLAVAVSGYDPGA